MKSVPGKNVNLDHKMFTDLDYNSDVLTFETTWVSYSKNENTNLAPCRPQMHTGISVFKASQFFLLRNIKRFFCQIDYEGKKPMSERQNNFGKNCSTDAFSDNFIKICRGFWVRLTVAALASPNPVY